MERNLSIPAASGRVTLSTGNPKVTPQMEQVRRALDPLQSHQRQAHWRLHQRYRAANGHPVTTSHKSVLPLCRPLLLVSEVVAKRFQPRR